MEVEDAIILLAGEGSRMFPASMYCPKEFLPLVDTPLMHHLVWEIIRAGIKRIHLVTSNEKLPFVEKMILGSKNMSLLRPELNPISYNPVPENVDVLVHIQNKSLGVGDAISIGCQSISGPFLVVLGDNALIKDAPEPQDFGPSNASNASSILVNDYIQKKIPCVGVMEMPDSEIHKYGVVDVKNDLLKSIIEKPTLAMAPSNLILCGRYLFPSGSYEILQKIKQAKNNEELSINFLKYLVNTTSVSVVELNDFYLCDSGNPLSWFKSQEKILLKRIK